MKRPVSYVVEFVLQKLEFDRIQMDSDEINVKAMLIKYVFHITMPVFSERRH